MTATMDYSSADISFDLERLFDPYNFDHIPVDKRLDLFKKRDLAHIKHYKAAVKIFGGPPVRTRVLIAPPMETPLKHRLGQYINEVSAPPPLALNAKLRSPPEPIKVISEEEKNKMLENEKKCKYEEWMKQRRKLNVNLENFRFSEELLQRKKNKSELEKRVEARLRAARLWKPEEPPPPEAIPTPKPLPDIPVIAVPPPEGLQILDRFLSLNRIRLIDLFSLADKDKKRLLSRQKFLSLVSKAEIPLSESEVDDLMITLDTNADNMLDFQELNQGLNQWRKQRREIKKQEHMRSVTVTKNENKDQVDVEVTRDVTKPIGKKELNHVGLHRMSSKVYRQGFSPPISFKEPLVDSMSYVESTPFFAQDSNRLQYENFETDVTPDAKEGFTSLNETTEEIEFDLLADKNSVSDPQESSQENNDPSRTSKKLDHETKTKEEAIHISRFRSGSSHTGSRATSSRSYASSSNSLQVPEPDLREEARAPESIEVLVDSRKLNRVVLSRNITRKKLSPVERQAFDEIPHVIKVGHKAIDDHCSESTLAGEVADQVNTFRREKLKEYYEVKKIFTSTGLPFTQEILDKVLLYPGDRPTSSIKAALKRRKQPTKNVWVASRKMGNKILGKKIENKLNLSTNPGLLIKDVESDKDNRKGEGRKHKHHRVEETYPFASRVKRKPGREKLSSGAALVKSKLDNWMTFEEYTKYTKNFQSKFPRGNHKSNPQADWTGHLLDKLYLCMDHDAIRVDGKGHLIENRDSSAYAGLGVGMYNGRGNALFRATHQTKRAYPGYNNDLLTWPVGDNGVRYGSIDEHRVIR